MARSITDYRLHGAILRQPEELRRLLVTPAPVGEAAARVATAGRVFTIGIGTSFNAAAAASFMLRSAGIDANASTSHDFVAYPPTLRPTDVAIVFTHSGRKRYSPLALSTLASAGTPTILMTGTDSSLTEADLPAGTIILSTVPRDPSAMFTVSHTTAMFLAARVADEVRPGCLGDLSCVPDAVAAAIALDGDIERLAQRWAARGAIIALGAGPHEPSAHEAQIKIAEASRWSTRSYAVEQFVHGPQIQVTPNESILVFAANGPGLERTLAVTAFAQALGCEAAWVSATEGPPGAARFVTPPTAEGLAPIVHAPIAQLLAGHLAALADVDGDNFRSDDEAHRTALASLGL